MNEEAFDKSVEILHKAEDKCADGSEEYAQLLLDFLHTWDREDAQMHKCEYTGRWQVWIDENRIDHSDDAVEAVA